MLLIQWPPRFISILNVSVAMLYFETRMGDKCDTVEWTVFIIDFRTAWNVERFIFFKNYRDIKKIRKNIRDSGTISDDDVRSQFFPQHGTTTLAFIVQRRPQNHSVKLKHQLRTKEIPEQALLIDICLKWPCPEKVIIKAFGRFFFFGQPWYVFSGDERSEEVHGWEATSKL